MESAVSVVATIEASIERYCPPSSTRYRTRLFELTQPSTSCRDAAGQCHTDIGRQWFQIANWWCSAAVSNRHAAHRNMEGSSGGLLPSEFATSGRDS